MRALLWRKETRLLPAGFSFLRSLRNLWEWWRPSPHTVQWAHRETHSLIKILAHLGVARKNWLVRELSSHAGLRLLEAESETCKTSWNDSGVTPGGDKLSSSTWAHYTSSLVIFFGGGYFFSFIFISWRLITLQYCSGFCHTLTWISHGFTCIPHPNPPSHLPLYPIPLGLSLVIFIADKFSSRWEMESLKNRNKGVWETELILASTELIG